MTIRDLWIRETHMLTADEARLQINAIRELLSKHAALQMYGGIPLPAVLASIAMGSYEARPFDVSSLAVYVNLSRQRVVTFVKRLEAAGEVTSRRLPRRIILTITGKGVTTLSGLLEQLDAAPAARRS